MNLLDMVDLVNLVDLMDLVNLMNLEILVTLMNLLGLVDLIDLAYGAERKNFPNSKICHARTIRKKRLNCYIFLNSSQICLKS